MTVRQLRDTLKEFDDNMEVVFQPQNSNYGESIDIVRNHKGIRAFWGKDYKAVVLKGEQVGAVWNEDEIEA